MKKVLSVILALGILCSAGCRTPYSWKRPNAFPNTKWVSAAPDIYFIITKSNEPMYGEIKVDGTAIPICIAFDTGLGMSATYNNGAHGISIEDVAFGGDCKFDKRKLVVTISKGWADEALYFPPELTEITFIREDLPS